MEQMTIEEIYMRKNGGVKNQAELDNLMDEYKEDLKEFAIKLTDLKKRLIEVK